jgi:hypothetical protein
MFKTRLPCSGLSNQTHCPSSPTIPALIITTWLSFWYPFISLVYNRVYWDKYRKLCDRTSNDIFLFTWVSCFLIFLFAQLLPIWFPHLNFPVVLVWSSLYENSFDLLPVKTVRNQDISIYDIVHPFNCVVKGNRQGKTKKIYMTISTLN